MGASCQPWSKHLINLDMCNPSIEPKPGSKVNDTPRTFLEHMSDTVDSFLSSSFGSLGESLGMRPYTFMLLSLVITVACCSGFGGFTSESRPEKLWIPQGTTAQSDQVRLGTRCVWGGEMLEVILAPRQLPAATNNTNSYYTGQIQFELPKAIPH